MTFAQGSATHLDASGTALLAASVLLSGVEPASGVLVSAAGASGAVAESPSEAASGDEVAPSVDAGESPPASLGLA